jgi:uncharacterized membrane protein
VIVDLALILFFGTVVTIIAIRKQSYDRRIWPIYLFGLVCCAFGIVASCIFGANCIEVIKLKDTGGGFERAYFGGLIILLAGFEISLFRMIKSRLTG